MSKRMIRAQRAARAIFGGAALTVFSLTIPFLLFLLIFAGEGSFWLLVLLAMDILSLAYCWHRRELFFGRMQINQEGIVYRCFGRRTVFVPWEQIESVRVNTDRHGGGIDVIRKESDTFRRSKANVADGYDCHIERNEETDELLKEYMPQRLKDMLGPCAFL